MAVPAAPVQEALKLRSTDRSLSLTLRPDGGHVALSLEAYGWRPVPDSGGQIDSLSLTGVAKPQDFNVSAFDVRVFNGAFRGRGVISGGEAYRVSGDLSFEHLNAGRMSEVLAGGALVQGEAAGEMSFSARAPNWQGLFAQFEAEGRFSFGRGGLRGIDFVEARALWLDGQLVEIPARTEDEPRFLVVGKIGEQFWSGVITYRRDRIRIISVRRARPEEVSIYES